MTWGMVAVAGAGLVGGMMSANAAGDAADTQAAGAREANQTNRDMLNTQIDLQEPWRQAGGLGLNKLSYLMGLSPTGTFQSGRTPRLGGSIEGSNFTGYAGGGSPTNALETEAQIRARLSPQFAGTPGTPGEPIYNGENMGAGAQVGMTPGTPGTPGNQAAFDAAVQAELAKQQQTQQQTTQTQQQAQDAAAQDPSYGSLLKKFTMADYQADPGYQFRLDEGNRGLERQAASRGAFGSGRFLKDLTRFNQGQASQEYGAAYDRFNNDNTLKFNRLSAISGTGQTASNNLSSAAQNYGNQAGANITGAANAQAAGIVGGANAINNGLSQGASMYQQNQLMNRIFPQSGGGAGPSSWNSTW